MIKPSRIPTYPPTPPKLAFSPISQHPPPQSNHFLPCVTVRYALDFLSFRLQAPWQHGWIPSVPFAICHGDWHVVILNTYWPSKEHHIKNPLPWQGLCPSLNSIPSPHENQGFLSTGRWIDRLPEIWGPPYGEDRMAMASWEVWGSGWGVTWAQGLITPEEGMWSP